MRSSTETRSGRHVVHMMHVHLVFVTKYRKAIFNIDVLNALEDIFFWICKDFEAELIEFEGERDHVHLLVNYPPKISVSKLVNSLKGVSSRILRRDFSGHISKSLWKRTLWSPSYFAGSCGGTPLDVIKKYIQNQDSPRMQESREECLTSPP